MACSKHQLPLLDILWATVRVGACTGSVKSVLERVRVLGSPCWSVYMDSHSCCAGREARTRDAMTADGPGDDGPQPPGLEPACSAGQAALLSAMACSSFFHSSPFSVPSPDLSGFSPPVSFKLSTAT